MGLDAYIFVKGVSHPYNIIDNSIDNTMENGIEIWYGRKEHELHNWMHNLFLSKGGDPSLQFNCESYVLLDQVDMDNLEQDLTSNLFEESDKELTSDYRELVYKIKRLLEKGNTVYYTSWW